MEYKTKATWLGSEYGCRIFNGESDSIIVEARCKTKELIGPTFRDLFRTLDTLGGDKFTSAVRKRKYKEGNVWTSVKHYWGGKTD